MSALSNLKHQEIAECFRSAEVRTVCIFNDLYNETLYTLLLGQSLKINVFSAK